MNTHTGKPRSIWARIRHWWTTLRDDTDAIIERDV